MSDIEAEPAAAEQIFGERIDLARRSPLHSASTARSAG